MNKNKRITGYSLHKNRVLFSDGEIIRTIKYPLKPFIISEENLRCIEQFTQDVVNDDLRIRGDVNLNDYLNYTSEGNTPYTLLDFWVDSLKAGVIWMPTTPSLLDMCSDLFEKIWKKVDTKIKDFFDKEKIKSFILQNEIRQTGKSKEFFRKTLSSYLKSEYYHEDKKNKKYEILLKEAEEIIDFITNSFFDGDGRLKLDNRNKQNKFWDEEFKIDKSIIQKYKPQGKLKNLTFMIIPELVRLDSEVSLEELINDRQNWLKNLQLKENLLQKIIGLSNKFNALSNYFGRVYDCLYKNQIDEIFEALSSVSPEISEAEDQVKDRVRSALKYLSDKTKILGLPSFSITSSWSDYRSIVGGEISSWFTNSQKRKKELERQIESLKNALCKTKEYLNTQKFAEEAKEKVVLINLLIDRLEEFLKLGINNLEIEKNYEIFDFLNSALKKYINLFYQNYVHQEKEEEEVRDHEAFKGLYEKIYKPVTFFGQTIKKRNEKIVQKTIPNLENGIEIVKDILSYLKEDFAPKEVFEKVRAKDENEEISYRKILNFFWKKYIDKSINSPEFQSRYKNILQSALENPKWDELSSKKNHSRYTFYKSKYAKGTVNEIQIKDGDYLQNLQDLVIDLTNYLSQFSKEDLLKDTNLLLDWIELSKTITSRLITFSQKDNFSLSVFRLQAFDKARQYINLFSLESVSKQEFSFIIQSLIMSEIRGSATLYSKKEYLAKYTVQVIDSNNKFKIFYKPSDPDIKIDNNLIASHPASKERKSLMKPHVYLVNISKSKETKKKELPNLLQLEKNNIKTAFLPTESLNKMLRLSSSPYQLQFLDKYLYRPIGWENIIINLSEWSFVIERKYKINWDIENKKPVLTLEKDTKESKNKKWVERIYLAIPFQISSQPIEDYSTSIKRVLTGKNIDRIKHPILGIDVGEYGLAYCLVRFDDNHINIIEKGFIKDKNIANIKDKFAEIQQKSREGAFEEDDSTVARVRENAIGALRNRIHHILINKEGSAIIYEYSISNFETGSGRTTKIYNSVKRADTQFESEADKNIHNHVWGKGSKYIGKSLSAYASSYTCVKCARSIYQIDEKDIKDVKVTSRKGNIVEIETPIGKIFGYSKDKKYQKEYKFKSTNNNNNKIEEIIKEILKIVKEFARPPILANSESLPEYIRKQEKKLERFRNQRGNSSIFVCPFVDCGFVADADVQASLVMAIRGYINLKEASNAEELKKINYLKETSKYLDSISNKDELTKLFLFDFSNSF